MLKWKKQMYVYEKGVKKELSFPVYHHPHAPAYVYKLAIAKTPWLLFHPGDANHGQRYATKKLAIAAFNRLPIKVWNLMTQKLVDDWDDTPYYCRVDSETYWSS